MLWTTTSALSRRSSGRLGRQHRDAYRVVHVVDRAERVEVGRVVAGNECAVQIGAFEQMAHGGALVRADRRQHLEHLPPEARDETLLRRTRSHLFELAHRSLLVGRVTEVERDRQSLQLRVMRRPRHTRREVANAPAPPLGIGIQLEAVRAHVHDPVNRDPLPHVVARSAADHADERVARHEPLELRARLGRRIGVLRPLDDRREHAVEVEEETDFTRHRRYPLEQRVFDHRLVA